MTREDKQKLADWLSHMQKQFECIGADPLVRDHIAFLKRSEAWVRVLSSAKGKSDES